ncbi:DUF1015 domain-containing protein [Dehalococcoidia bacterium]|nr:DUF1015 domain-containing protein [Dehalococcoidia bacterium]
MADVRPFAGIRYNAGMIGDPSSVITPPYDVITPEQQSSYYQRNPCNVIRLELGQEFPDDIPGNDKYTRAANTLNDWLRDGVLFRERCPAFYLVEHRFSYGDSLRSYWGIIAAVRLDDLGAGRIRPTEITMKRAVTDRIDLLRVCRANLSPIMGIFQHEEEGLLPLFSNLCREKPSLSVVNDLGVTFNVWAVTEAETVRGIAGFLAGRTIYIADGNHRYQAALAYRDEQLRGFQGENPPDDPVAHPGSSGNEPFNFVMMTLIGSLDPGLVLLPTHRLVKGIESKRIAELKETLSERFQIQELPRYSSDASENLRRWTAALTEAGNEGMALGLYGLSEGVFYLLTPGEESTLHKMMPGDKPAAWKDLDVSVLHWAILRGMLGIDSPEREKDCLEYSVDGMEVLRKVDTGMSQLAFFLNPVPISSLFAIADAGMRMPPKSTYFHPKTPAGLVINPLWE